MTIPRSSKSFLRVLLLVASLLLSGATLATPVLAQQPAATSAADDLTRGLELYKQGDDKGATEVLRGVVKKNENEIAAWYYMALAYERQGKKGDARKSHEKSALAGEWLIDRIYSTSSYTEVPAVAAKYKPLFLMAAESAKKYLELGSKPSRPKAEQWNEREQLLRDYAALSEETAGDPSFRTYRSNEVETRARITNRPEPQYTEEARANKVTGTVVLRAIFAFDGRVRAIRVFKGLPDGLSFEAVKAARRIKFIPAMVNGKPVSQYIQIEYNFHLY